MKQHYQPELTTSPTEAVIYCRVSSKAQEARGDGLNSQETMCRQYAASKGYAVIAVFPEVLTGRTQDRPVMKSLISFLRKKKSPTAVIIDDVSRFARNPRAHWPLRDELKQVGGVLESPKVRFGDDPAARLVEGRACHGRRASEPR